MDSNEAIESADVFLRWLNDYGALKLWACWGMICTVGLPIAFVWTIRQIGRPMARIALSLEKSEKE